MIAVSFVYPHRNPNQSQPVASRPSAAAIQRLDQFQSNLSVLNRLERWLWGCVWISLFRCSPRLAFGWRRLILRVFGAKVGPGVRVYPSVRIFLPRNLRLDDHVVVGPDADLYCVDQIHLHQHVMVSQYAMLCTATHDYRRIHLPLVSRPIVIEPEAWVCARAIVGPGRSIGRGAVIGAGAVVFTDVPALAVMAGNPAIQIRDRGEQSVAN